MSRLSEAEQSERMDAEPTTGVHYAFEPPDGYRIDNYDLASPFSSFLPGVAGRTGVPLWAMYVNRAQAIVSFGVGGKNDAIAEFLPATWAYQLVGIQGFRTFCKIDGAYYEPFSANVVERRALQRSLRIEPDYLQLSETNPRLGLAVTVAYFSPVGQPLGSLVRRVTIRNTSKQPCHVELLDGLPVIVPSGITDDGLKRMRHLHEAYASVRLVCGSNAARSRPNVPLFAAKVVAHDEAEVTAIQHGNFYAAWHARGEQLDPIVPFVDPHVVFGAGRELVTPTRFIDLVALNSDEQVWENRLPCALAPLQAELAADEALTLIAVIGRTPNEQMLPVFLDQFRSPSDFDAARRASRATVAGVVAPAITFSALPVFDAYARQNYLDNVLRGGVPEALPSQNGPTLLHVYARRHGDLERDYNSFDLPPHPLSSGSGNFRDICQNRRWDVWFYPDVLDGEIASFVSLLQADGYNPLAIAGYRWRAPAGGLAEFLPKKLTPDAAAQISHITSRAFQPGELLHWLAEFGVDAGERLAWLTRVLERCQREFVAGGHEGGYWIDHWTYITDLLEAFAVTYPDRVAQMLSGPCNIAWFDEGAFVRPRSEKYLVRSNGPLQLGAVTGGERQKCPLPAVSVLGKLVALVAIKAVSFDYGCRGIEMEAGRPGWNDSLNGLPGLFGSSTCEAAELARLARWLRAHLDEDAALDVPEVVAELIASSATDVSTEKYDWNRAAAIRETFRAKVRAIAGERTTRVPHDVIERLLAGAARRGAAALENARVDESPLVHTYHVNRPEQSMPTEGASEGGARHVAIERFTPRPLPLYLEGQVHWLRLQRDADAARDIYRAVRNSPLFDAALQMYKINECLDECSPEIGRARTFTRGWFENESIWLHMSYKYLLELLRAGLFDEFYADAETMLVPFMPPAVYGRSILENSSFLASSANPDRNAHGRGHIARLSGSTAEFIHMWLLLTVGPRPFFVDHGELRFQLQPALRGDWFTETPRSVEWQGESISLPPGAFGCALLGATLLVYHNGARADTFGQAGVRPVRYQLDGETPIAAEALGVREAQRIRERQSRRLDVWLE